MILGGRGPAGLTGPCTCRIALFLYGPQHTLDRLPAGVIFPLRPGTVVDGLGSPSAPLDFLLVAHSGSVVRAPLDGAPQSDEAIIVPSLLGVISPFSLAVRCRTGFTDLGTTLQSPLTCSFTPRPSYN